MTKTTVYDIKVQFGDCDPAGIVFFPNFSKWMDAASLLIGTPLLEIHTKFMRPATYGETLHVHTSIESWAAKTFVQKHVVMRGDTVLCEGRETRAFVVHPEGEPDRIKAIPVPEDIKALCS